MASTSEATTLSETTRPGWLKKSSLGFYRNGGTLSEGGRCSYKETNSANTGAPQRPVQSYGSGQHGSTAPPDLGPRSRRVGCAGLTSPPELGILEFDEWPRDGQRSSSESDQLRKISETSVSSLDSQDSRMDCQLSTE